MTTPVATLQLTFDDEFTTFNNSPNGTTGWETRLPYYGAASRNLSGAGEAEYYSDSSVGTNPFTDTDGVLSINATTVAQTGKNALNEPYNSGAITTYDSFAQEYGYFEINAKLPTGNGFWSAFWLSPTSLDGQSELDGFEVLGNNTTQLYATTHSEVNGTFTPNLQEVSVPNAAAAFHTYGVDWEPTTITWYEDGVAIATAPTPANMDEKMFLLLNLAVGAPGSWPGAPTSSSEFPGSYQVDYVHAYATAATKYVSGTAAIGIGAPEGEGSITGVVAVGLGIGTPIKGVTVSLLSTGGTVLQTTTSDGLGDYQFTYVAAGNYQIKMTPPSGYVPLAGTTGTVSTTLSAGQADLIATLKLVTGTPTTGSVTGSVLLDNGSSTADLSGVTVTLLNTSGGTVSKTTTNSSGVFSFASVTPNSYEVKYTAPSGDTLKSGPASTSTGITGTVTVTAGQTTTLAAETLMSTPVAPTTGGITGSVLLDNGSSTAATAGVTVTLLNASGGTVSTATTNSNGAFSFASVTVGSYEVQYTVPSGDTLASGPADASSGITGTVTVTAGQTTTVAAETLAVTPVVQTGTITGSTLLGSTPQGGVVINLMDTTGTTVIESTTSNSSGIFTFNNVVAGYYKVDYVTPSGEVIQSGPANPTTGLTIAFGDTPGVTRILGPVTFAAASVTPAGGTITGSTELGTSPQSGIAIHLLNAAGTTTIATTLTNSYGIYGFSGLAAGYYRVEYIAPSGESIVGGPADATTGETVAFSVAAGGTRTMGPVTFGTVAAPLLPITTDTGSVDNTASLSAEVVHQGSGDHGTPQSGVSVTLLDDSGTAIGTTVTDGSGSFTFDGLAAGTYQVQYTTPDGEVLSPTGVADPTTGLTTPVTIAGGVNFTETHEDVYSSSNVFTLAGESAAAFRGDGSYVVSGAADNSTLTLGDGDQNVTLSGTGDTVTVGQGTSTIAVSGGNATIHTDGGADTISVTAGGNLLDAGPGMNFLTTDGTGNDTFMLNASGQGLTSITGFQTGVGDTLDLSRTLAGIGVSSDLSNIGSFVTSDVSGGNTTLYVTPPGGSAYAVAQLTGTATTVDQLLADHAFSMA